LERLAQIARWEQALPQPVVIVKQQNVHVAVELAVLETIV
jgi:hypothetical protein